MAGELERRVEIVVCDKHGLKYNAAEAGGCVRCRREAGRGVAAGAVAAGAPQPRRLVAAEAPASAAVQLLLAAVLVAGTGTLFWTAHRQVVAGFSGMLGTGGEDFAVDTEGDGLAFGDNEPAAYPPDGVTIGPAEEQRQMNELMRQMQEDDEKEARDAAARAEAAGDDFYDDGP